MKKIFLAMFTLLTLTCISSNVMKGEEAVFNEATLDSYYEIIKRDDVQYDVSGMLLGVDAVKSTGTGWDTCTKTNHLVLDYGSIKEFLSSNSYIDTGSNSNKSSDNKAICETSAEQYSQSINSSIEFDASVSASKDIFTGKFNTSLSVNNNVNYSSYLNTMYVSHTMFAKRYTIDMTNTYDLDSYRDALTDEYRAYLAKYFAGTITYDQLVDLFGTHIISSASYGGAVYMTYTLSSNQYKFNSEVAAKVKEAVEVGAANIASSSSSIETEINSKTGIDISKTEKYLYVKAIGGNAFACSTFEDYSAGVAKWAESTTNENCALLNILDMIPLWDILPSEYNTTANINKMINDFSSYVDENVINFNAYNNKTMSKLSSLTLELTSKNRSSDQEYEITDDSIGSNPYDYIDLNNLNFFDLENDIYKAGFRYATISFTIDMCEDDYGYQEFYILNNASNSEDDAIWSLTDYEYFGSRKYTSYTNVEILAPGEFKVNIDNKLYDKNKLYFRYSANGSLEDNWKNKNIKITITFSKC